MNFKKPYYSILEIERTSSKDEIKAAYRRLAMKHHPDKNAGDEFAATRFREIQESYEILSNEITRNTYDVYHSEAAAKKQRESVVHSEVEKAAQNEAKPATVKTFTRTRIIKTEKKIYVKGLIEVKYWGDPEMKAGAYSNTIRYKIFPTKVEACINETDIYPIEMPQRDLPIYEQAAIFQTPISHLIRCVIQGVDGEQEYLLRLGDLKIVNPILKDVTRYEEQSLGTLQSEFYAHVNFVHEEEITEVITESSGATGRAEEKRERETVYERKEYYHADGTTFWSDWVAKTPAKDTGTKGAKTNDRRPVQLDESGCSYLAVAFVIIFFLIVFPKTIVVLLFVTACFLMGAVVPRLNAAAGTLLFGIIAFVTIVLVYNHHSTNIINMNSFFDVQIFFPIGFILLWILIAIYGGGWLLRKAGIARVPIGGIEYSEAIVAGSFILGMLLITTASIGPLFGYYRSIADSGTFPVSAFSHSLLRHSFVLSVFSLVFVALTLFASKYLPGVKSPIMEIKAGNIPLALILGMVSLGIAIVLRIVAAAVIG